MNSLLFLHPAIFLFPVLIVPTHSLKPDVVTDKQSIEVGPGPNALRLKDGQVFTLNCTIINIGSYDTVNYVQWTYENELDNVLKTVTVDEDDVEYDSVNGKTIYKFDHHPTSADAGDYNCTFYGPSREILAQKTVRLTCDPVPIEGPKAWKGLKENDPMRRDYKHVPSYTIYPGDEQSMDCRATAYPRPQFKWYRIEQGIEDDDDIGTSNRVEIPDRLANYTTVSFPLDGVIVEGAVLRIQNATYAHRGYYCCSVNNSDDYSLNMYFLVRVKDPWSVMWPLIGIGIITCLMTFILGINEYVRHKEAKLERLERAGWKGTNDQPAGYQMRSLGEDSVKLRNAGTGGIIETRQ